MTERFYNESKEVKKGELYDEATRGMMPAKELDPTLWSAIQGLNELKKAHPELHMSIQITNEKTNLSSARNSQPKLSRGRTDGIGNGYD